MRIIILGAGQVGASVAEALESEQNDITLVDLDRERLNYLQDRYDIRSLYGNAAYPSVLRAAGAEDADVLIAATQSDQTNLVACKLAHTLFNLPTRIARLRSADFLQDPSLLAPENFAVDFAICPEEVITDYIVKLIYFPEALQVLEFAGGRVSLVAVRAVEGGPLVRQPLKELPIHLPNIDFRVAAIFRHEGGFDRSIIPSGNTVVQPGDEVFCLAANEHIRHVLTELRKMDKPVRRVMIAGGGNIGVRVAQALQKNYEVKVLESKRERASQIADQLTDTLVLHGDATDEDLFTQENIEDMDVFLALTNDDEDNIMAATLAKRMGCRRVLALINRKAYAEMVQGGPIDIALSPAQIAISTMLAQFRKGDVTQVYPLRRGMAEALEIVAHGDNRTSRVVGRRVADIEMPEGAMIAALVRNLDEPETIGYSGTRPEVRMGHVEIAHGETVVQAGDHVIVFCANKKLVHKVEKLFQVGFGFL